MPPSATMSAALYPKSQGSHTDVIALKALALFDRPETQLTTVGDHLRR
jgi:hypothetical protein